MKKNISSVLFTLIIVLSGLSITNCLSCSCGVNCACNPCNCGK